MENGSLVDFFFFFLATVTLFGIFLLSFAGTFTLFTFFNNSKQDYHWMAALSLGLGPVALSWSFTTILRLFPDQQSSFYVLTMAIFWGVLAFIRLRRLQRLIVHASYHLWSKSVPRPKRYLGIGLALLSLLILSGLFFIAIFLPLTGNDPLEYAQAARIIANNHSVDVYPFINTTKENGFFAPWTHPLGYINLLTFGYMVQGSTEYAGVIRLIAPFFALVTAVAIWDFSGKNGSFAGPIAALLLLATPLYFHMTAQSHIDTMRIFTFMATFIVLYHHFQNPRYGTAIIVGFAVGMSQYSHSSGILTLPILIPLYLIVSGLSLKKSMIYLVIIITIGLVFILPRWLTNIEIFGSLAADQVKVWTFPELHFKEHLASVRLLNTPLDKIYYGLSKGLSYPLQFGPHYYIFIFVLFWMMWHNTSHVNLKTIWKKRLWVNPTPIFFVLWVLAGFYGIVLLSILLGKDLIIKNSRYILTIQPFICIVIALNISDFFKPEGEGDKKDKARLVKQ